MQTTLYLIPNLLGLTLPSAVLPARTIVAARALRHFAVETPKAARAFLKTLELDVPIADLHIEEVGAIDNIAAWWRAGNNVGVVSDAGCPGIADPGAALVAHAHAQGVRVVPLVGPSSITLALMASGMNGQQFQFHGYLPSEAAAREAKIRALDQLVQSTGATQIFIETPYRNHVMLNAVSRAANGRTLLCAAQNLTLENELIVCKEVSAWTDALREKFASKSPTIYLLGRAAD